MRDLTVVVSVPGSSDRVAACLGSLAAQTLPADRFEVVVVVHGPGDAARDAVERACRGPLAGHEVELVDAVAASSAAARNVGVSLARAAWTTLVDAAQTLAPQHLEALYAVRHPERVAVATAPAADTRAVAVPAPVHPPVPTPATAHVRPHLAAAALRGRGSRLYPTRWLVDTPFVEGVCGAEDTVLHGHLFSRFDLQFAGLDLTPGPLATGHDLPQPGHPDADGDHAVQSRLAVLTALTVGTQADPPTAAP
ncbi:glycosyltransferase family A protein [Terrabacter sp. C0L_2]|uniref:glycosyltransferase family A protein n=1 Tax=Terrabacter sp. C0L_2 TaxID=3108389 RepID=UPI002ED3E7F2|nr:glycosyltransferase family A protein [Terrabacter sp. C0L_2]